MIAVNPCPFCGHKYVEFCEVEPGTMAVDCPECQCIGPFADSPEEDVVKWNLVGDELRELRTRASVLAEMCQKHEREIEWLRNSLGAGGERVRLGASYRPSPAKDCVLSNDDEHGEL
jgi:hypothetical protein